MSCAIAAVRALYVESTTLAVERSFEDDLNSFGVWTEEEEDSISHGRKFSPERASPLQLCIVLTYRRAVGLRFTEGESETAFESVEDQLVILSSCSVKKEGEAVKNRSEVKAQSKHMR